MLVGNNWQSIHFVQGRPGVPDGWSGFEGRHFGLLTYQAAQALRWWWLAELRTTFDDVGIETRLIKHKITYTRKAEAVSAQDETDGRP